MQGVPDGAFDFLTSSHCLEHLHDPVEGLANWFRVVRPGGYLVIVVPDEDLFEQGQFPSTFNRDHKHTFTIHKDVSWSERSHNVLDLCRGLGPAARLEKVQLLTASYRFDLPRLDQTLTPVGEAGIEFVIRKASDREASTGVPDRAVSQPPPQLRRYYNQYRRDHENLKRLNVTDPPFQDESDL
jgi:SAM-dependent methyltransferase